MSGKRSRKKQKRKPSGSLLPDDLLKQARELLTRGDGRRALDRLKQVGHEDVRPPGTLPFLRFWASTERARELARSGLDQEAAAMHAQAAQHRASISTAVLAEEDLARYLRCLDAADSLATYVDCLRVRPAAPAAERALADRLVVGGHWDGLDGFAPDHPLRRDAGPVKESLDAMDAGDWERAAEGLRSVSRHSPYAHWRVFCKAMQCFGAGDDVGLMQALDLLPVDFPLAGTIAEWRRICAVDGAGGPVPVRHALGTDGTAVQALGDELARALRANERGRTVERLVVALADALCPEEPLHARIDLLQIIGLATLGAGFAVKSLPGLFHRLLPAERVAGLVARTDLLLQQVSPASWKPVAAAALLDHLDKEFPRAADRPLARGRVLDALARTGHQAVLPESLAPETRKTLSALLGQRFDEPGKLFADLMAASLEADPRNRDGYRFLIDRLREHGDSKPRLRAVLKAMAEHFPDDPGPWLELAVLDYSMNAYRRAEQALAEVRRRAPHDERVLDLQFVGFLKSADQSRKSGRFQLAAKDLDRAGELERPRLESFLRVKRILLDVVSAGRNAVEVLTEHLAGLPLAAQVRVLAVLVHDLEENRHVRNVRPEMESGVKAFLAGKAASLDEIDAGELARLLAPLPADLHVLYNRFHVAPVLAEWWQAILRRQEGDALLEVFDILMGCGGRAAVRAEIGRRLSGLKKPHRDPLLLLYLAVIRYQQGDDHGSRRFNEALEAAQPADRERLRAASARLAGCSGGLLREALLRFDFAILDPLPMLDDGEGPSLAELGEFLNAADDETLDRLFGGPSGGLEEGLPDEVPEDEPDEELSIEKLMEALREELLPAARAGSGSRQMPLFDDKADKAEKAVRALEAIIDRMYLRGVPVHVLRNVVDIVRDDAEIRRILDTVAAQCAAAGLSPGLSREAQGFLFPNRRKRRRR